MEKLKRVREITPDRSEFDTCWRLLDSSQMLRFDCNGLIWWGSNAPDVDSALGIDLASIPGVNEVWILRHGITVDKSACYDWSELEPQLTEVIELHVQARQAAKEG